MSYEVPSRSGSAALPPRSGSGRGAGRPTHPHREPEPGGDLRLYWDVLRRRWPLVAAVVLVVVLGTAVGTLLKSPVYRASGVLEIRKGDADVPSTENLFREDGITDEYLQTQVGILESHTLAGNVVRDLRLDTVPPFASERSAAGGGRLGPLAVEGAFRDGSEPAEDGSEPANGGSESADGESEAGGTAAADDLQPVVERVRKGLEVDPREGSRLVRVSFEAEEPRLAADVVNAALDAYQEMRVRAGEEVASWLARQLDSTKVQLRAAERDLRAYATEHDLPVLQTAGEEPQNVVEQRLREQEEELTRVQSRRIEAESRYRQVVEQDRYRAVDNKVIQDLTVELATLRKEYARITSVFQEDYPGARQVERQIENLEGELEEEKARVASRLESEYRVALRREKMLQEAVEEKREAARQMADESGEYRIRHREVEANRRLLAALQKTKREADVSAALEATRFGVVDRAVPPREPEGAGLAQNLSLALLAGLVLGVGAALFRERLDASVRSADEVDALVDAPVLALIPSADDGASRPIRRYLPAGYEEILPGAWRPRRAGDDGDGGWPRIDAPEEAGSRRRAVAESFEALRAELLLDGSRPRAPRSLLVTSCQPREGKTTISLNLALSLASAERRVLLVDADLRRPSLHRALGIDRDPGIGDHLTRGTDWRSLVRRDGVQGLDALPAGQAQAPPSDVLASSRMRGFLAEAERSYDCVVLDSVALFLNNADARILASLVDGVVVVVRSGMTPRSLARRVMEKAPNVLGVILNDLRESDLPSYYGNYFFEYGSEEPAGGDDAPPEEDAPVTRAGSDDRPVSAGVDDVLAS